MSLQNRLGDLITAVGTDYKQLRTWLTGSSSNNLTGLTTADKASIIGAINEVNAKPSSAPADATEAVRGILELATLAEVATGTDTTRAVTPAGVRQEKPIPATEAVVGLVELASLAEVATGTDSLRVVTVAGVRQERVAIKNEILGAGVPAALDTLDELAAALGDNANYAASVTTSLAGKQPLDPDLTALAALPSSANTFPYAIGAGTWALADLTPAARALLDDADVAAMRTTLSVYSQAEMGNPETDLVALYNTAKA